jgi:hypothetical protein
MPGVRPFWLDPASPASIPARRLEIRRYSQRSGRFDQIPASLAGI